VRAISTQAEVEEALSGSREITQYLVTVARKIVGTAATIAPKRTGHYVQGLAVVRRRGRGDDSVYVAAKDFKSHWIEWGAGPSPEVHRFRPFKARHVLERATRAHVKKFKPSARGAL
jgi:hypothetical protein